MTSLALSVVIKNLSRSAVQATHSIFFGQRDVPIRTKISRYLRELMISRASRSLTCLPSTPLSISKTRQRFITPVHRSIASTMQPKISDGQDESKLMTQLKAVLETGWKLDDEEMGVKKKYYFKTYTKALVQGIPQPPSPTADLPQDFLYIIGVRSKSKNHNPVMTIVRSTVSS